MTRHGLPLAERFWMKVDRRGADECWPWTASCVPNGYGQIAVSTGRFQRAHRIAYMLTHGPIPDGLVVRHDCDNPPCCNPAHLRLGTQADNRQDMYDRSRARGGRTARPGEANPNAKLTADQVAEIRERRANGATFRELAQAFGIAGSHAYRICSGSRWAA